MQKLVVLLIFLGVSLPTSAVELLENFPLEIHPTEKYVFYSHGLIVEGANSRPIHPDFGTYEFPQIKQKLFQDGDFNLIAHHRPVNTVPDEYAEQLISWVNQLIDAGVSPSNITLIGFSRGAQITARASNQLRQSGINTALMAVCFDGDFPASPPIELGGHILSIYETTDVVKSCSELLDRSQNAKSIGEIAISTSLGHGAFYAPLPEWLNPLKAWLGGNSQ